ncbi:MAG: DUF922 domain-containing protein [Pirellulales bacterium]|nr:DUF922 domain-containing protein [Pirellulales bacterium]
MAGEQSANPLGRNPFDGTVRSNQTIGSFGNASPIGVDMEEPVELGATKKISKVTKDWADPPVVTPTLTPEVSGSSLKAVLVELQKLTEWGSGGGKLKGTGPNGEMQAEPSEDGKSYTVAIKGEFILTLVKWKEYGTMTAPQKKAWDDMIALLTAHEREHVAIAYRNAEKLIKTLKGLDVMLAPQKVADANTAGQADQDDFDSAAKTDHGKNDYLTFKKVVLDTSADPPPTPTPAPPKP